MSKKERAEAVKQLSQLLSGGKGTYSGKYGAMADALMGELEKNDSADFDAYASRIFADIAKNRRESAKNAVGNTVSAANALAGGYEPTYSASAAFQQYAALLQNLADDAANADIIAANGKNAKRASILKKLDAARSSDELEREKYEDDMNEYYKLLKYWAGKAKK